MEEIKLDVRKITERKLRFKSVKKEKGKRRTKKGCCLSILFAACFCLKVVNCLNWALKLKFMNNPGGNTTQRKVAQMVRGAACLLPVVGSIPFNNILLRFWLLCLHMWILLSFLKL